MTIGAAPLPAIGLLFGSSNADTGLFYVTSQPRSESDATLLLVGRKLSCAHGSFTLTGQDATLSKPTFTALAVAAPLPSISLAWGDATGYMLGATGTFTVSGPGATFRRGIALIAETGTYTLSGAPAERDLEIDCDAAFWSVNGRSVDLLLARKLACDYGTFTLTGQQSSGTVEDTLNRRLSANVGYFVLTGQEIQEVNRMMFCETGAFSILGGSPILDGPIWVSVAETTTTWADAAETSSTWTDV